MDLMQRRRALMMGQKTSRLPPGFQEVEWLEATGTQYIITNIFADDKLSFTINAFYGDGTTGVAIGCRKRISSSPWIDGGASIAIAGTGIICARGSAQGPATRKSNGFYEITNNQNGWYIDNQLIAGPGYPSFLFGGNWDMAWSISSTAMAIFAANDEGSPSGIQSKAKAKIKYVFGKYNAQSPRNDFHFVPCYRESDNKPGLYDLCGSICPLTNSPFYINAGTDEFLVGPEVN